MSAAGRRYLAFGNPTTNEAEQILIMVSSDRFQRNRIRVNVISRGEHRGYYSIEKVFRTILNALPEQIDARQVVCPVHAQGVLRRLICLLYISFKRAPINHITGDVSFLALALPAGHTIITIHDFGRLYSLTGLRALCFRIFYFYLPFRLCRHITVISPQIAAELIRLFPFASGKVSIIPNCVPEGFHQAPNKFNVLHPTILQVGTAPNKNIERLVYAIQGLPCELCIVGPLTGEQRALLRDCGVKYTNHVHLSEQKLLELYRTSDIVAFVSTYEGFGVPILEGNAVGRPVVTSNIKPMEEVAGDAACLVDPHNVQSIRDGLWRVIMDSSYRAELVTRGFRNVERFSAADTALRLSELYLSVAAKTN